MLDAVVFFGLLNVAFEFIVLSMVPPRTRLRVLGNHTTCVVLHLTCLGLNLWIHWGTLIGTMSGIFSFICSIGTVWLARLVFGFIVDDRHYTTGLVRYSKEQLI
jgi:hypothetical protein